jgi:hypothetical protein
MSKDQHRAKFADFVTGVVLKRFSRRGFMRRIGEGALVLTGLAGMQMNAEGAQALADIHASCPATCYGVCICKGTSTCITNGVKCSCSGGNCGREFFKEARLSWFFAGTRCVPDCACVIC